MMVPGSREAEKADMGESSSRVAAEGRVQAMQLKLFIETLVLQKHENPRYKEVAREACEENTRRGTGREGSSGAGD